MVSERVQKPESSERCGRYAGALFDPQAMLCRGVLKRGRRPLNVGIVKRCSAVNPRLDVAPLGNDCHPIFRVCGDLLEVWSIGKRARCASRFGARISFDNCDRVRRRINPDNPTIVVVCRTNDNPDAA